MGTVPDSDIAATFGMDPSTVSKKRRALGIASYSQANEKLWTPEVTAYLGLISDAAIVAKFHLRVTPSAVAQRRLSLGIPSADTRRKKVEWTPEWLAMLGNVPDDELAQLIGIHPDTVGSKRRMTGKPKYTHN